jgi:hypothetical protein
MYRKLLTIVLTLGVASIALADFGLPNDLLNPSFETGELDPWFVVEGADPEIAGEAPPECGSKAVRTAANWGQKNSTIGQIIPAYPEQGPPYMPKWVEFSGWVKTWQKGGHVGDARVYFDIHQYGNLLWESPPMYTDDTWEFFDYTLDPMVTGLICDEFMVTVRFEHLWALEWNVTWADCLDVQTFCIPEPATIALLGLGGLALLRKRR